MKKILIGIMLCLCFGLTGCKFSRTYYGEYAEKSGSYTYITKVYVYTKGDEITKVEFASDSNHHTDPSIWTGATVWKEKEENVLKSFEGQSVKEIKKSTSNEIYDNVAGATLTSNRVYQAVKNALNG